MKKRFAALLAAVLVTLAAAAGAQGSLPDYAYTGDDPITGAVAEYTATVLAEPFMWKENTVAIPLPIIVQLWWPDPDTVKVTGTFWTLVYEQRDDVLVCIAGGEAPGILTLKKDGETWKMTDAEIAGDGDNYGKDITRFCGGDKELEEEMFYGTNLDTESAKLLRAEYIRDYVEKNGLKIKAYQDEYWDPVPLYE